MNLFYKIVNRLSWGLVGLVCMAQPVFSQSQTNLLHHFSFNGTLSNTANTTSISAVSSFAQDRLGINNNSYEVASDNYSITASNINNLPSSGISRTVAFWCQVPNINKDYHLFSYGTEGNGYSISYNYTTGNLIIGNGFNTVTYYIDRTEDWRHIAVSFNSETYRHSIYVNGVYKSYVSLSLTNSAKGPLNIGVNLAGTKGTNFKIDELFVYDRALSEFEVYEIYSLKCRLNPIVNASKTSICPGENVNLTSDKVVYVFSDNGNRLSYSNTYISQFLNSTTTFYVIDSISSGCYSNRVPVTITVKEDLPDPVSVTDILQGSICGDSGIATLKVQEHPDYTVKWYTSNTGGTPIATGPVFVTPILKSTTKYYFANEAPDKCPSKRSEEYVWIYPKFEVDFVASKTKICPGDTVTFSGFEEVPYYLYKDNVWVSAGDLYSGGMPFSYQDAPTKTSTYINKVGEWFGCTDIDTITITVIELNPTINQSGNVLSTDEYQTYQWYKNDELVEGATAQTFEISESGSYHVSVTNDIGCSEMSDAISVTVTSLTGKSTSKVSNLYPNPANSTLHVELKEAGEIKILSMLGEQLENFNAPAGTVTIDVTHLNSGIYLLQTDNGESIRFTKN